MVPRTNLGCPHEGPRVAMCSGSEAVLYFRLIDFGYHSTLGLRDIKREREKGPLRQDILEARGTLFFFCVTLKPRVE